LRVKKIENIITSQVKGAKKSTGLDWVVKRIDVKGSYTPAGYQEEKIKKPYSRFSFKKTK
jgi:hypothetical protein